MDQNTLCKPRMPGNGVDVKGKGLFEDSLFLSTLYYKEIQSSKSSAERGLVP